MKLFFTKRPASQLQTRGFKKLYLQLLLISIAFILIPTIILGSWFYFTFEKSFSKSFYQENTNLIENISRTIQQNLSMIENDIFTLKNDSNFYNYQRINYPGEPYIELARLGDTLGSYQEKYGFVQSIYFYDPGKSSIYSSQTGIYDIDDFYDTDWIANTKDTPQLQYITSRMNINNQMYQNVKNRPLYIYSPEKVISIIGKGYQGKSFIFNISVSKLYQYLTAIYPISDQDFYIIDNENNLILENNLQSSTTELSVDVRTLGSSFVKDDNIYFTHAFNNNQFTCILKFPNDFLHNSNKYFMGYILVVSSILTVVLIILAQFVTKAVYNPLNNLITGIKKFSSKDLLNDSRVEDELTALKQIYTELNENKLAIQSKLDKDQKTIFYYKFKNYLNGLSSYDELSRCAENVAVSFDGTYYKFILFSIPETSLFFTNRENIFESINTYISDSERGICFDIFQNSFLAYITSNSVDYLLRIEHTIIRMLIEVFNLDIYAGSSDMFQSHVNLIEGYEQAQKAFQFTSFFDQKNINQSYPDIIVYDTFDYSFIASSEVSLTKAILANDREKCRQEIQSMKQAVLQTPDITYAFEAFHQILMILDQKFDLKKQPNYNLLERLNKLQNIVEVEAFLNSVIDTIIVEQTSHAKDENTYCETAKQYLEEHFSQNISVTDVADALNISYPYLSKLFKDYTSYSLLDYLNNLRISKAKEFLAQTCLPLPEISEQVGYNNVQSFQRFFKKFEGLTPGEFRKLCQHKKT